MSTTEYWVNDLFHRIIEYWATDIFHLSERQSYTEVEKLKGKEEGRQNEGE